MKKILRHRFEQWITQMWRGQSILNYCLLPLSWLFGVVVALRRYLYDNQLIGSEVAPRPVIIIGNTVIGGSGKTPTVMAMVQLLQQNGVKVGLVSRGYGGTASVRGQEMVLTPDLSAHQVGDEPKLIAHRLCIPVAVGVNRPKACQKLVLQHPEIDVLVLDDGLQHYRLQRNPLWDTEVVVQPSMSSLNQWLLPAGPYRESSSRYRDLTITPQFLKDGNHAVKHSQTVDNLGSLTVSLILSANYLVRLHAWKKFPNAVSNEDVIRLDGLANYIQTTGLQKIIALANIANPERFFEMFGCYCIDFESVSMGDHAPISKAWLNGCGADMIVITEKDAIKCDQIEDERMWVLPIEAAFAAPDQQKILQLITTKLQCWQSSQATEGTQHSSL